MADYFVKTAGSDGNNGTTWALAKATVQAGMNLCTTAGDRCVVAAGTYYETGLAPPSAGTRASKKTLIGDYNGTIADGGSNYSGVTGYIIIDGSVQTGNKGWGVSALFASSNNWAYWNLSNLYVAGSDPGINPTTAGTVTDGVVIDSCIFVALGGQGFGFSDWNIDPDTYSGVTIKNTIMVGANFNSGTNECSAFRCTSLVKSTSFYTNPQIVLQRCILLGSKAGLKIHGTSTLYLFLKLQNCTIMSLLINDATYSVPCGGSSSTYNKVIYEDCYIRSYGLSSSVAETLTNCKTYFDNAYGASTESSYGFLPFIPYLFPESPLIGSNTSPTNTITPDIFGASVPQGTYQDYGAQEFVANRYPKEPTMILPTPGGSGVSGVSRARVVNAGGI